MTLLSATQLREHIETDLGDGAIDRIANAAEKMIDREIGAVGAITQIFNEWGYPRGRDRVLFTTLPIGSITSIKERDDPDDTQLTLSADDFRQEGNRSLIRLRDGTNPRLFWAQHTEIIYALAAETEIRELVQINLVKLNLMYSGARKEKQGDFDFWHAEIQKETRAILAPLNSSRNKLPIW